MTNDEVLKPNQFAIRAQLAELRQRHRELDMMIQDLPATDTLQLQRLKKQKLALKDRITVLEDNLLPDIIA
jgi:hypothetical protein